MPYSNRCLVQQILSPSAILSFPTFIADILAQFTIFCPSIILILNIF